MRIGPFVLLAVLAACGPPPVDPQPDADVPPITADAGAPDAGHATCPHPGLTTAELRSTCGEPCWTNERAFEPASLWLYDCEGPGGTCVTLDGGVAVTVGWCSP